MDGYFHESVARDMNGYFYETVVRERLRCGWSSSTSFSKGMSWCEKAPSVTARTRSTSSRAEGAPER